MIFLVFTYDSSEAGQMENDGGIVMCVCYLPRMLFHRRGRNEQTAHECYLGIFSMSSGCGTGWNLISRNSTQCQSPKVRRQPGSSAAPRRNPGSGLLRSLLVFHRGWNTLCDFFRYGTVDCKPYYIRSCVSTLSQPGTIV